MSEERFVHIYAQAHRNSSGRYRGKVTFSDREIEPEVLRCFPFFYNPDAASYVVHVITDEKQQLPLFRVIGDPLYKMVGERDCVYPEFGLLSQGMISLLRAGLCAHISEKYPLTRLGKVAPTVHQLTAQAERNKTCKRGTAWIMPISQKLLNDIASLPELASCSHFESFQQLRKSKKRGGR